MIGSRKMYAIIQTGGKQYRVTPGQLIEIEKISTEVGKPHEFTQVLMLADGEQVKVGQPLLADCPVKAEVVEHKRGKKVEIIKFKRRKHHLKHQGHRQHLTVVRIMEIGGKKAANKQTQAAAETN